MTEHSLLDDLCQEIGCLYLSDLRLSRWRGAIGRWLLHITADDYPQTQWEDAYTYLLHQSRVSGATKEQLRQALLAYCRT